MDILLVDDDEMALKTIGNALIDRRYPLRTASNGVDALHRMEDEIPDLVICDVQMPGIDGIEFLRTARERFPDMPIILMTGGRDMDTAIAAFRSGAYDVLKKPIQLQELLDCIKGIEERINSKKRRISL